MSIEESVNERIKGCDVILNTDCTRLKELMDKPNDEIIGNQDILMELSQLTQEMKTVAYTKFVLSAKVLDKEEEDANKTTV